MKHRHIATGVVALTTTIAVAGMGAGTAHAAGHGDDTVRLANSGRTALPDHAQMRTLGVAPADGAMNLSLTVPLRHQALMDQMLSRGTVISPAQYDRLFGASPASLEKVARWAKSHGLRVISSDAAGGLVNVQAPVRTVNKAFGLKMQRVKLGARTGVAPNSAPQLPKSLRVTSVIGLSTVTNRHAGPVADALKHGRVPLRSGQRHTLSNHAKPSGLNRRQGPLGGKESAAAVHSNACSEYWGQHLAVTAKKFADMSNPMCGYSPQQAVKMYHAGKAKSAKSNIGILLWCDDKKAADKANLISKHFKYDTLADYHDESAAENGTYCDGDPLGVYAEQNMDIQASHYMAPEASIYYYGASGPTDKALLDMFGTMVKKHKVSTISMSWGGDEAPSTSSFQAQFDRTARRASLTGISLFASSGDMGDGSIEPHGSSPSQAKTPSFPATSPYVTAVGGTVAPLAQNGSREFTGGWSNTLWEQFQDSSTEGRQFPFFGNSVGAGGGVSTTYAQPVWQKGVVTGSTTKRAYPDVSAIADPASGLALNFDDQFIYAGGGTSQSSPLVAALVASSKAITHRKVGNAAPYFYKLRGSSNITDVKPLKKGEHGTVVGQVGTNGHYVLEGLEQPADSLRTKAGWDNVTGLGEPSGTFLTAFGK